MFSKSRIGGAQNIPTSLYHFVTQNVNILVKTKNAPKALKRKINLKIFCDMSIPIRGEGGGSAHLGIFPT